MRSPLSLELRLESYPLTAPFRISGYTFTNTDVVIVTLHDGDRCGRGEACGVYYFNERPERMAQQLEDLRERIEEGLTLAEVQTLLPPGGARNALDCAMWDLRSRLDGVPVWMLAGIDGITPLVTTFTVGADDPVVMAKAARAYDGASALKLKLTGDLDLDIERVRQVRAARPECWIGVDGNQGFAPADLPTLIEELHRAGVKLLEQPLRRGQEAALDGLISPIPIAADESLQSLADLPSLVGRFQVANIKLDKCGGLTEALKLVSGARALGLKPMVGCMTGSSLSTAPAFVVGQLCDHVDLDGAIFLARDFTPSMTYSDGKVSLPAGLWGDAGAVAG
jgi:L-alanine-DL-glutamate epimerase-like enolase superfamily enzyme